MGQHRSQQQWVKGLPIVWVIWLVGVVGDRLWFGLDRSVPAWDQADYLTGALTHWYALQTAQWFSPDWWADFWQLSSKIPPLFYVSTAPCLSLFGIGADQSTIVNLLYSGILFGSVYLLGTYLFSAAVGMWAAGLCLLLPGLYRVRLDYLLDYPLVAMVTLSFACLTVWRGESRLQQPTQARQVTDEAAEKQNLWEVEPPDQSLTDATNGADIKANGYEDNPTSPPSTSYLLPPSPSPFSAFRSALLLPWLLAIAVGLSVGLALMIKQSALLVLLVPLIWVGFGSLWRQWRRLLQLILALAVAVWVAYPWYRTNWLLILTSSKRATVDSAIAEGDPSLVSLDAWTYYLWHLPSVVSLPLLVVPLLGLLLFWRRSRVSSQGLEEPDYAPKPLDYRQHLYRTSRRSLIWLMVFLIGAYLLSSLNINKDIRYGLPLLPVLAVILAYGFSLMPRSWRIVQWSAIALAVLLMGWNLFPLLPSQVAFGKNQFAWHRPVQGIEFPHAQVIDQVIQTTPYLQATIGVLPSTPDLNQHNINYYGIVRNRQVYGRQVGTDSDHVVQDGRSLDWFLTKSGEQGSIRNPTALATIMQAVQQGSDFAAQKTWKFPDGSDLTLYHRRNPALDVKRVTATSPLPTPIQLDQVTAPEQAPPGRPIPVTYRWSGLWSSLQSGLVIMTWHREAGAGTEPSERWLHDHSIALNQLYLGNQGQVDSSTRFEVTERLAMLPPATLKPGLYTLDVTYINQQTGNTVAIATPPVSIQITPDAAPIPAPELDLVTQLRTLAETLPQGMKALDRVFDQIARISQYDPVQSYVIQTQQTMAYRLKQEPLNRDFAYTLALAHVLQRSVDPAIAALQQATQLDPKNPYAHAYLAVVNLYDFRPHTAQIALNYALELDATIPELHALNGVAALMQGNLKQAWREIQTYRKASGS